MSDEPGDGEWGDLGDEIQDRIDDAIEVEMEKRAAMTDHATRARENGPERDEAADIFGSIVEVLDLTELSIDECNACVGIIRTALSRAAEEERERCAMVCESTELRFEMDWLRTATKIELSRQVALDLAAAIRQGKPVQAAQPAWSKDTPTVAGQYWHRGVKSDDPVIVRVVAAGKRLLVLYPGDPLHYTLPNIDERGDSGEWAGPLSLPREA